MFITVISPFILDRIGAASRLFGSIGIIMGITLWPFVIFRLHPSPALIAHEGTHAYQQMFLPIPFALVYSLVFAFSEPWALLAVPLFWFPYLGPFYIWYGVEYLIRAAIARNGVTAYRSISFEQHAYAAEVRGRASGGMTEWARYIFAPNV